MPMNHGKYHIPTQTTVTGNTQNIANIIKGIKNQSILVELSSLEMGWVSHD